MNVGALIDEEVTPPEEGFSPGDLVIMPQYHEDHKFLVLGGQIVDAIKNKWKGFVAENDVVITGIEPDYSTFMKIHSIAPSKIQKVGVIKT